MKTSVFKNLLAGLVAVVIGGCSPREVTADLFVTENGLSATRVCPALDSGFLSKEGRRLDLQNRANYSRMFGVNFAAHQPLKVLVYQSAPNDSPETGIWGMYVSCIPATSQPNWDVKKTELQNEIDTFNWHKANPSLYGQTLRDSEFLYDQSFQLTIDIVLNQNFDPTMVSGPDSDHDGVPDSVDQCPTMPRGTMPDPQKLGCPIPGVTPPAVASACMGIGVSAAGFEQFVCWLANGTTLSSSADLTQTAGVWYDTSVSHLPSVVRLNTSSALSTDAATYDAAGNRLGSIANMASGTWYVLASGVAALKSNYPMVGFRLLVHAAMVATMEKDCALSMVSGVSGDDSCQP